MGDLRSGLCCPCWLPIGRRAIPPFANAQENGLGQYAIDAYPFIAGLTAYVEGLALNPSPNSSITVYNVSNPGRRPTMGYEVAYLGPWTRHGQKQVVATTSGSSDQTAPSSDAPAATSSGADVFSTHCAACHGATGSGGVGPSLHGIANRKTLDQTIAFIENPTAAGIVPKLYPSSLTEADVQAVASYIQTFK